MSKRLKMINEASVSEWRNLRHVKFHCSYLRSRNAQCVNNEAWCSSLDHYWWKRPGGWRLRAGAGSKWSKYPLHTKWKRTKQTLNYKINLILYNECIMPSEIQFTFQENGKTVVKFAIYFLMKFPVPHKAGCFLKSTTDAILCTEHFTVAWLSLHFNRPLDFSGHQSQ